jgi:hypothetical protein
MPVNEKLGIFVVYEEGEGPITYPQFVVTERPG